MVSFIFTSFLGISTIIALAFSFSLKTLGTLLTNNGYSASFEKATRPYKFLAGIALLVMIFTRHNSFWWGLGVCAIELITAYALSFLLSLSTPFWTLFTGDKTKEQRLKASALKYYIEFFCEGILIVAIIVSSLAN